MSPFTVTRFFTIESAVDWLLLNRLVLPVVVKVLKRAPVARSMLATEFGEIVTAQIKAEGNTTDETQKPSWDELMLLALKELEDTPGGRGDFVEQPKDALS
jgi:hypothetical protein